MANAQQEEISQFPSYLLPSEPISDEFESEPYFWDEVDLFFFWDDFYQYSIDNGESEQCLFPLHLVQPLIDDYPYSPEIEFYFNG